MSTEYRPLLMRANRLLGAQLVERNFVTITDLEKANERFYDLSSQSQPRQITVLGILAYEMKVLAEEDLLHNVVDTEGVGLVDLRDYEVPDDIRKNLDTGACWATWSLPFDKEEEFHFVATAYYLSPAVRAFWEKQLGGPILWFGITIEGIADFLEKLEGERRAHQAALKPVVKPGGHSTPPLSMPPRSTGHSAPPLTPAAKPRAS